MSNLGRTTIDAATVGLARMKKTAMVSPMRRRPMIVRPVTRRRGARLRDRVKPGTMAPSTVHPRQVLKAWLRLASSFHRDGLRRLRLAGEALAVAARRAGVGRDFGSLRRGCGALTGGSAADRRGRGERVGGRAAALRSARRRTCVSSLASGSFIQSG